MTAVRRIAALACLLLVLAGGLPLVADPCAGVARCCPAMAMRSASAPPACARAATLAADRSCCRTPAPPATAPTASLGAAAPLAAPQVAHVVRVASLDAPTPAAWLPGAARSRAERRHELGLFTLHSVYRI